MSFERGNLSLTVFRLAEKLPENALEMFATKAAGKLEDVRDEVSVGFTSGRDLLETNINENTGKYGGHIFLNLRIAQRKIPAAVFNAECRRAEFEYMTMRKIDFIPSKVRRQIKKDIEEKRLPQSPVEITGVPFVLGPCNTLYLGTTSPSMIDTFLCLFYNIFNWEPEQLSMEHIKAALFKDSYEFTPLIFSRKATAKDYSTKYPGRDFLTWLWFYSEEKGGKLEIGSEACEEMLEGPLVFAMSDEAEGSRETVVRKDNPLRSVEAKAALMVGKKLKKAKLTLARGEEMWKCTFDADRFTFSGLSLPDGMNLLDNASMFAERVNSLYIFQNAIQEYFKVFFQAQLSAELWPEQEELILNWAKERGEY